MDTVNNFIGVQTEATTNCQLVSKLMNAWMYTSAKERHSEVCAAVLLARTNSPVLCPSPGISKIPQPCCEAEVDTNINSENILINGGRKRRDHKGQNLAIYTTTSFTHSDFLFSIF